MITAKHFDIRELVPKHVYDDRGIKAWRLLDPKLITTLDALREAYGPMTVNNWHWGGNAQWRGLRTSQSPIGSQYSQHRYGRAADVTFRDRISASIRFEIMDNPELFPFITELETDIKWFHFACGTNVRRIMTYKP